MGVGKESVIPTPKEGLPVSNGVKYQIGIKGSGKTGTTTRGARGGFRANTSEKGTYSNKSSYTPKGKLMSKATPKDVTAANPFVGTGYWHGLMLPLPEEQKTNYVTVEPEVLLNMILHVTTLSGFGCLKVTVLSASVVPLIVLT